ncbi:hypothetical protein M8J76_011808 [Diaphorina citri]|nr:hypothetical protein M8J75_013394 [Diaphorina citri]KAI5723850.1 hypothetical protein M8J76_011808 [Diaphorina citri]
MHCKKPCRKYCSSSQRQNPHLCRETSFNRTRNGNKCSKRTKRHNSENRSRNDSRKPSCVDRIGKCITDLYARHWKDRNKTDSRTRCKKGCNDLRKRKAPSSHPCNDMRRATTQGNCKTSSMRKRQQTSTSYDECCRRTRHAEVVCPDTYAEAGVLSKSEECHCSFCLRLSDKRPPCCLYAIRSQLGRDNTGSCLCLSDRRHPCCLNAIRSQLAKDDTGNQSPQRPYRNSRYAGKCRDDGNSDRTNPFLSGKNIPRSSINKLLKDYSYYLDHLANSVNDSSSSSEDEPGSRDDGRFQPPEMDTKNKTYKPSKEKKKSSRKTNKKRREKEEAISEEGFSDGSQYEDKGDGPYQPPEMDMKNKTYKPSKEKKKSSRKTNKKRREKEEAISEEEFSDGSQYEDTGDGPYQPSEMDMKNKTYKPSKEKKKSSRKTNKKRREKEEAISEEKFSVGSQYEDTDDGPYQPPEMDTKNKTYKPSKEKKKSSRKTNKKRREKEEAISEEGFSDGSQYEDTDDGPYQPPEMDTKNKTYKPSKEKKKSSRKTNKKRREKEEAISEEKFGVGSQYEDTGDGPYQPSEMDMKNKTYKPSKEKKKSSRKTNKKRREKEEAISEEKFSDGSQYEGTGDGPYQPPEMDSKNKTYKPSKEKKKSSRKTNKRREKEEAISEEEFSVGSQYEDTTGDGPYQPSEMDTKDKPSKEKKKSSRKTNKKRREKEEATSEEGFSDGSSYEDTEDDKITVRQPRHRYKVPGNDDPFKIIKALNQQYGENMDNLTVNIERKPTDGLDKTRLKLIWS